MGSYDGKHERSAPRETVGAETDETGESSYLSGKVVRHGAPESASGSPFDATARGRHRASRGEHAKVVEGVVEPLSEITPPITVQEAFRGITEANEAIRQMNEGQPSDLEVRAQGEVITDIMSQAAQQGRLVVDAANKIVYIDNAELRPMDPEKPVEGLVTRREDPRWAAYATDTINAQYDQSAVQRGEHAAPATAQVKQLAPHHDGISLRNAVRTVEFSTSSTADDYSNMSLQYGAVRFEFPKEMTDEPWCLAIADEKGEVTSVPIHDPTIHFMHQLAEERLRYGRRLTSEWGMEFDKSPLGDALRTARQRIDVMEEAVKQAYTVDLATPNRQIAVRSVANTIGVFEFFVYLLSGELQKRYTFRPELEAGKKTPELTAGS